MIQDQSIQSRPVYEQQQVQVINTTDQPVCITGLDQYLSNTNSAIPIVIEQVQSYPTYEQYQPEQSQANHKIILITSNSNNRVENIQSQSTRARARTPPRTRIIQVPFLTKRPSTTPVVKQNYRIKYGSVKTIQKPLETQPIEEELIRCKTCSSRSAVSPQISQYEMISKVQTPSSDRARPTLASLAGLQLTGSAESIPTAMSGAMPTATVEEINVPVFINEYLQQSATLPPIPNGDDHTNISNKSTASHWSENTNFCTEEDSISIENCPIDSDVFDKFEFDLESIETDENTTDSNTNFNNTIQQQQIDMMFNNNKNNNNIYYNIDEAMKNFEEDVSNIQFQSMNNMNGDSRGELNKIDIKEENETSIFSANLFSSVTFDENDYDDDDDEYNYFSMLAQTENAIDISPLTKDNELPLSQILISSQNDPMISCTANNNSQTVLNAEPIVPDIYSDFLLYENNNNNNIKMEDGVKIESFEHHEYDYTQSASGAIKRLNNNSSGMHEKRQKLHLETANCSNVTTEDLNTPDVIELIDEMGTDKNFRMHYKNPVDIVSEFMNLSNSSFQSAKAETNTPSTIISFDDIDDQPSTPQSCISSSYTNQTHTITSPNSPALSSISTATRTKSRRGRPPKQHSDRPDPSQLRYLSESERKRAEDRAKNNEASRLSRLKTKRREEEEIEEECQLIEWNTSLVNRYKRLCTKEEKLKFLLGKLLNGTPSV